MAKKKSSGKDQNTAASTPYVVLARKYRPQTFDDLIGQEAMVRTLSNAFSTDRIAQGYMLTGVRGVGKTTTARILARALNYSGPGIERPTIDMPVLGEHCPQIMESRHPDVLEMDAASNTGIDNIREIIESARYKPMAARYKVYIIDEVHMLSKGAFNALLKTLEEPPEHVKFIFATTEIRKVPVTVLSRCQRFDLRRVDVPALTAHFKMITGKEGAAAEDEALALIARAAEGSVRDGLSILDQAISTSLGEGGGGKVTPEAVRAMLGLADRGRIFDLADLIFKGDAGGALKAMAALHHDGAEAGQILADLAEIVHVTARLKAVGPEAAGEALSAEERRRAEALAVPLSMALLSRAWQMLLKGLEEAVKAPNPLAAAEMVLIRLAYTADLPTPDEIIRTMGGGAVSRGAGGRSANGDRPAPGTPLNAAPALPATAAAGGSPPWASDDAATDDNHEPGTSAAPAAKPNAAVSAAGAVPSPQTFQDVVDLVAAQRDPKLVYDLEEQVSLVKFEPGKIELHLLAGAPKELANELREKLNRWTGRNWILALSNRPGQPALGQVRRDRETAELAKIAQHPAVKAVMDEFPDAKIKAVTPAPRLRKDTGKTG